MSLFKDFRRSIIEFFEAFVTGVLTILLIFWLVGQPLEVTGDSMLPTFQSGEQIFAEKLSLRFRKLERFDIIIVKLPENKSVFGIKRVIGIPGDIMELSDGKVFINGELLAEPFLNSTTETWGRNFIKDDSTLMVPENSYVVFGDNREVSQDSRVWGLISKEDIVARPVLVYLPTSSFRIL